MASAMWRENVPDLSGYVPDQPTTDDAASALLLIRETFKTFCFADAETMEDCAIRTGVVNTSVPPNKDESGFLAALLTAVCRPSLHLSPGVLLRAAPMSGTGAGKGLLARCISIIAFGREPHAVTGGASAEELEKRIAAELIEGSPVLFLDNLNNTAFKSNLLASAITERPARVRLLGRSQMVPLNASSLVILAGNGLNRIGGPCPPLYRRRVRPANGRPRGAIVHDRHPGRRDPPANGIACRRADDLALGSDCPWHRAGPARLEALSSGADGYETPCLRWAARTQPIGSERPRSATGAVRRLPSCLRSGGNAIRAGPSRLAIFMTTSDI